jgi:OmcA/MtrC family decaheme c-type cytochrome
MPGPGLDSELLSATVSPEGVVQVTFTLTDTEGSRIVPTGDSTSDPDQARVRFTLARLEIDDQTVEGFTTTFTRYVNYITRTQTSPITAASSDQPTYDSGGTFALVDAATGTYSYTFATPLPEGFPASLTHTVGAQVERTAGGERLIANPLLDFVPAGGPVTVVREGSTTAQCNSCHDPLAIHGGGRREVGLCLLCHTDQAVDPDTGNTIDFPVLIHKIHRGRELPSIDGGAVGTKYEIIGFGQSEHVYSERMKVCDGGRHAAHPCASDADCPGGTCSAEATAGVAFPQDIRNCEKCHADGVTADNHRELASTPACTACHDDVNPGQTPTAAGPPGTGHLAGPQPEAFCRLCHTPEGEEFGISVKGAHTIPARSAQLAGLRGEILSATGVAGEPVTIRFRLSDDTGTAIDALAGLNRVAVAMSGPTTDLGGGSVPLITATIAGGGASGTLTGPDGSGVFTYTLAQALPEDAAGSWRVGLEARRSVAVEGLDATVTEALQNPVLDFSVDGSPVVPRRKVVDMANCGSCHGVFSKDFGIHGNLRNQAEYCVICHNANVTDFARRAPAVASAGADPDTASIHLKVLLHKIHTGEELEHKPYIVYGFDAARLQRGALSRGPAQLRHVPRRRQPPAAASGRGAAHDGVHRQRGWYGGDRRFHAAGPERLPRLPRRRRSPGARRDADQRDGRGSMSRVSRRGEDRSRLVRAPDRSLARISGAETRDHPDVLLPCLAPPGRHAADSPSRKARAGPRRGRCPARPRPPRSQDGSTA